MSDSWKYLDLVVHLWFSRNMQNWHAVEHKIWKDNSQYREFLIGKRVLVAVSGGRDSMVLLQILINLRSALKLDLAVAFVHHGQIPSSGDIDTSVQDSYRIRARDFVHNFCTQKGLEFYSLGPSASHLSSEEQFRNFRYEKLLGLCQEAGFELIALGHHAQDLFETRLIRLIRGTGAQGLEAMGVLNQKFWRPMLKISDREVGEYREDCNLGFVEDPSNGDQKYMRNWLRQNWLRQLEEYRPGATESFSRSLENLANAGLGSAVYDFSSGIKRDELLILTHDQKCQRLALYLHFLGVRGFRQGQLEEILSRLDIPQRVHSFKLAQCLWTIDANCVKAERF